MRRSLSVAILFILYFLEWIFIGLFFGPFSGLWFGIGIALFLLLVFFKYGEKIILSVAKARYINDDDILVFRIRNLAYLNSIPEVKVYWSDVYSNNIYCTQSYRGTPSIILGRNLYSTLSKNELNALIYSSLQMIVNREVVNRTVFNLLMMNLLAPIKLISILFKKISYKPLFQVLLLPTYYLKNALYDDVNNLLGTDKKVVQLSGLKYEYASALFKVSNMEFKGRDELSNFVMTYMGIVENKNTEVLKDLISTSITMKERLRELDVFYV